VGLKRFPHKLVVPAPGTLQGLIFENPAAGVDSTLFHEVRIPVRPFDLDGKQVATSFDLNFIDFGPHGWGDLDGRTFHFKKNPEEPYVDGAVALAGVFNPVDVPTITFGKKQGLTIPAELELAIDFEYEGAGFRNTNLKLRTSLTYEGVRIDGNVLSATPKSVKKAKALAGRLLDLAFYREPEIIDTSVTGVPFPCFMFRPR
jgi:hypothetical protein